MKPLVSILIPAYNAERTVMETIQSAIAQTWQRKEIIVVNDGSTDRTAEIVERFAPAVKMITTQNRGLSAAVNRAYQASEGDYIQELDADDMLVPDKIERQLEALAGSGNKRILLSSPWAPFFYRTKRARFIHTTLCQNLSPADWLLAKLGENLHMQNATWLVSRELAEAAGPWKEDLYYDQDGEYFARVVVASEGVCFVPGPAVYYRSTGSGSISAIGKSNVKRESLLVSMKLHIQYLRSLEDSVRVRRACLTYLQNWYGVFDPERPDLASQLQEMAVRLGGSLNPPHLRRKYAWMAPLVGHERAKWAQDALPQFKASWLRKVDHALCTLMPSKRPKLEGPW